MKLHAGVFRTSPQALADAFAGEPYPVQRQKPLNAPNDTDAFCDALPIAIALGRCHTYALFGPREWVFRKRRRHSHYQHCADRYHI
jgi:hypothetical protein